MFSITEWGIFLLFLLALLWLLGVFDTILYGTPTESEKKEDEKKEDEKKEDEKSEDDERAVERAAEQAAADAARAAELAAAARGSGGVPPGTGATGGVTVPGSISATTNPVAPTPVVSLVSPNLANTPVLTKVIALTKDFITQGSEGNINDHASFGVSEVVVRVKENGVIRPLTAADYSSAVCDDGSNVGYCAAGPASYAIDGIMGNLAHTNNIKPQLIFTLNVAKHVVDVNVFNRLDCCKARLAGVKLTLYSEANAIVKQCILDAGASYLCTP